MCRSYAEIARAEGRDVISLSGGLGDWWVCTHCEGGSPGVWGEGPEAIVHKPDCPKSPALEVKGKKEETE